MTVLGGNTRSSSVGNPISDQRLQDALVTAIMMEFPRCSRRVSHLAAEVSKAKNYDAAMKVLIDEDAERETSRRPLRYELSEAELPVRVYSAGWQVKTLPPPAN